MVSIDDLLTDINSIIQGVILKLGQELNLDRITIYSFEDGERPLVAKQYKWSKSHGLVETRRHVRKGFDREFPISMYGKLKTNIPVVVNAKEPGELDWKVLESRKVVSLIAGPVMAGNRIWGFISMEDCTRARKWDAEEIKTALERTGEIGTLVAREDMIRGLKQSEEKHRFLLENMRDILVCYNASGTLTYISKHIERIAGYKPDEIIGRSIFELLADDYIPLGKKNLVALKAGRGGVGEYRVKHRDGRLRWYHISCQPIMDRARLKEVISVVRDITDTKRAEEDLVRAEAMYRTLAENMRDMLIMWDMELNPIYISPAVKLILGYTPSEAMEVFSRLDRVATRHSLKVISELIDERINSEDPGPFVPERQKPVEIELIHKDGYSVWTETKFSFLRDKDNNRKGIISVTRDISGRKHTEKRLRSIKRRCELLASYLSDLVWITDMDLWFTYISPSVKEILGYDVDQAMKMEFGKTLSPGSFTAFLQAIKRGLMAAKSTQDWREVIDIDQFRKDGKKIAGSMLIVLLRDENGTPDGFMGITRFKGRRKVSFV